MKKCSICQEEKDISLFVKRSNRKSGVQPYCKVCHNKRMRGSYRSEYMKDYELKKNYGISLEDFENMHKDQDFRCAICSTHVRDINGKHKKTLCVDHCHETGVIRGLLCDKCNRGIGLLQDSPEVLASALSYLNKFK